MVRERTATCGEVGEVDSELDTLSSSCCGGSDVALDVSTGVDWIEELGGGQDSSVDWADWVVQNGDCITEKLQVKLV